MQMLVLLFVLLQFSAALELETTAGLIGTLLIDNQVRARKKKKKKNHVLSKGGCTFLPDDDVVEYRVDRSAIMDMPSRSVRARCHGSLSSDGVFVLQSFEVLGDRKRSTLTPSQSRTVLVIFVNLVGTFGTSVFTNSSNTNTVSKVNYYFWDRPWGLNQYYAAVTRNSWSFDPDLNRDGVRDMATGLPLLVRFLF